MSRRKTITISIILLIFCYVLYTRYERVQRGNTDFAVVTRIEAGSGRSITILLDDTPFEIPSWCYEINQGQQVVVPTTMLQRCCGQERNPKFKLLTSTDRTLVGLVSEKRPNVIFVLHDFDSGETWPRGGSESLGRRLRNRLQADNPQISNLALSSELP
jgi:hypothetical protein